MKKVLCLSLIPIFFLCGIQIKYVNSHSVNVPIYTYSLNEEVKFERNFFGNINESSNGYSITVLGTDLMDIEAFKKNYSIKDEIGIGEAYYVNLIHVKIKNCNNSSGTRSGIDIQRFILQNGSYITYFYPMIYSYINSHNETKFSLPKGQELEVYIPFVLSNNDIKIEDFNTGDFYLVISLYPNKCMIKL